MKLSYIKKVFWTTLVITLVTSPLAYSMAKSHHVQTKYQDLIRKISHGQLEVVKEIPGHANLVGLVVKAHAGGSHIVMYVDKDARYALYGSVFNPSGEDLVAKAVDQYINPMVAQKAYNAVQHARYIQDGHKGPLLNIIIDLNCTWCHELYSILRSKIDAGQLQVRWIPVGIIKPDSEAKAAAALVSKNPVAALAKNDGSDFDIKNESGALKPLKTIPTKIKAELDKNLQIMTENGFRGTPVILYKNTKGQTKFISGMPKPEYIDSFLMEQVGMKPAKK